MKRDGFFTKFDWAAFSIATLVTFGVYFYTLGPSVGLEDSGELATAGAHLGVPHAPGYPFWTFVSWIFCKVFAGVTYMGHPTPAWAISLFSAVAGALAAGCTAMLICRSANDLMEGPSRQGEGRLIPWLSFAGGVGGALTFAFSPVEWSQSTIVEIYSLNSLFLMLVLLLSYRWMRKPSDKVLWLTAFVFGLGLTNYQVLLFAIVPLALVILLRNLAMFRDFALYLIPVLMTLQILQVGELGRAELGMARDVIEKHAPAGVSDARFAALGTALQPYYALGVADSSRLRGIRAGYDRELDNCTDPAERAQLSMAAKAFRSVELNLTKLDKATREDVMNPAPPAIVSKSDWTPSAPLVILSLVLFTAALLAGIFFKSRAKADLALKSVLYGGGGSVALLLLSATLFSSTETWAKESLALAPLAEPIVYVLVAAFTLASAALGAAASMGEEPLFEGLSKKFIIGSIACAALAAASAVAFVPSAGSLSALFGYFGEEYPWAKSTLVFATLLAALFALASFVKKGLCYAIPVAGFHLAVFLLLSRGAMNGLTHPASWWFWWPLAWNFAVLALAWHVLPYGRSVAGAAFFTQLGVAFYAYMPIVSDLRNPPMNWAYPRTWEGFKHAITRGQYEQIKAENFDSAGHFFSFMKVQMGHYFADVKLQFTDFLVLLAAVPFAMWKLVVKTEKGKRTFRAIWTVAGVLGIFLLRDIFGSGDAGEGSLWWKFDRVLVFLLAAFALVGILSASFRQFLLRPAIALSKRFKFTLPKSGDKLSMEARDVSQQWLLASGACFLVMSVLLIVLAKVQGDIQDNFIQKVKFIMSHAMIALWIGYGLVVMAVLIARLVPARFTKPALAVLVPLIMVAAAWQPLSQNYTNDRLVLEYGGSEQNGHTFGWQFGAYQLDGAKAIEAQISDDEEPLPDPDWPPAMEDHAVFFGGTDPGRFVPTYMIYAADFRPDVYLITQNALADGTYMQVERDLYGDEIWIPANEDNAQAFSDFVGSLSEEEKAAYGVSTENGRVQVTGALSVMKINERLTQMMFEKNSPRHAFYVEESYPIDWMYDYLTPHGLIMKIERKKSLDPSSGADWPKLLRRDRDFWDWYTRRLIDDPMFRRDFAAQKSFAKLRSAIAGIEYDRLRHARDAKTRESFLLSAEQAYREACLLAPISPESTIRYLQTRMMAASMPGPGAQHEVDVCTELLDHLDEIDPRNVRTKGVRSSLNDLLKRKDAQSKLLSMQREADAKLKELDGPAKGLMASIASKRKAKAALTAADFDAVWKNVMDYSSFIESYRDVLSARQSAMWLAGMAEPLSAAFPECVRTAEEAAMAAGILSQARKDELALKAVGLFASKSGDPQLKRMPIHIAIVLVKGYFRQGRKSQAMQTAAWAAHAFKDGWTSAAGADPELGAMVREFEKEKNSK